ncbi:MAG: nucleoside deaminase [Anaerolineales bacterium]|nr:nucleoside deaminase [Anaerolineales bacterium]
MAEFWDSLILPWQVCLEEAWLAYCSGSIPIGAVVMDANGAVVARGRNRRAEPRGQDGYISGTLLAHAELNALNALDTNAVDAHGCILYTTTEPCPLCMGAVYMVGVRQVYYASRDPYAGSVNMLGSTPYLSRKPVRAFGPERRDLELAIMTLFVEFAIPYFGDRALPVFEAMQQIIPASIRLGKTLYEAGDLRRLRAVKSPAHVAWDFLAAKIQQLGFDQSA